MTAILTICFFAIVTCSSDKRKASDILCSQIYKEYGSGLGAFLESSQNPTSIQLSLIFFSPNSCIKFKSRGHMHVQASEPSGPCQIPEGYYEIGGVEGSIEELEEGYFSIKGLTLTASGPAEIELKTSSLNLAPVQTNIKDCLDGKPHSHELTGQILFSKVNGIRCRNKTLTLDGIKSQTFSCPNE